MNKLTLSLVVITVATAAFIAGSIWKATQAPLGTFLGWTDLTGWTEEERDEFIELIDSSQGASPREFYTWVKESAKVNEAVLEGMRQDDSMSIAYCIAILGIAEKEDLAAVKDFCIERMAAYYKRDNEGTPELIMEGINKIKNRIDEEAEKHPKLLDLIEDNQSLLDNA